MNPTAKEAKEMCHVSCGNCGRKKGLKNIHISTKLADHYFPYCPTCHGNYKEYKGKLKTTIKKYPI